MDLFNVIFLILVLFIIAAILLSIARQWLMQKRVIGYCQGHGLTFYGKDVPYAWQIIKGSALNQGHSQIISWGIGQKAGDKEVLTFQYRYTIGAGRYRQTLHYRIALMHQTFSEPGSLILRKEKITDKLANVFGMNDLDFESKAFSDRFYVQANPPQFAYKFFHPRMMEIFLKYPQYNLIIKNDVMLVYQEGDVTGFFPLLTLLMGKNPFADWMEHSKNMLVIIEDNLPNLIRTGRRYESGDGEDDEEMIEIVDPEALDAKVLEETERISCPDCSHEFTVPMGQKSVVCPKCGSKGEV